MIRRGSNEERIVAEESTFQNLAPAPRGQAPEILDYLRSNMWPRRFC
jgi:hypothetical protein